MAHKPESVDDAADDTIVSPDEDENNNGFPVINIGNGLALIEMPLLDD